MKQSALRLQLHIDQTIRVRSRMFDRFEHDLVALETYRCVAEWWWRTAFESCRTSCCFLSKTYTQGPSFYSVSFGVISQLQRDKFERETKNRRSSIQTRDNSGKHFQPSRFTRALTLPHVPLRREVRLKAGSEARVQQAPQRI